MSWSTSSFLPRCPYCGKIDLPPHAVVISVSSALPPIFCEKTGQCERVECAYCGYWVNPVIHDWYECNQLQLKSYEQPTSPLLADGAGGLGAESLRYQDVLSEAERILRKERE